MDKIKPNVEKAVTHYAQFYAALALNESGIAQEELEALKEIDQKVKANFNEEEYSAYYEKRSQLMRIFRDQLMVRMKDQIQDDVLNQAEELIEKLEIIKS